MEERLRSLSPQARSAVNVFAGATSPVQERAVHSAMANLRTRAATARKRLDDRYFQGKFLGPVMHTTQQMHLRSHHQTHDELIDTATSHVSRTIKDHERITRRSREQFANDTYKEQAREARKKVIDQDNEILLRGLFNVADRRSEYKDALFLERINRVTNARNLARKNAKDWEIKSINRENQEILRRLCNTNSAYDAKKWESDFAKHKRHVKMSSKVKKVKSRKPKHKADFNASSSKAERDTGLLLPDYNHVRDKACLSYTQSKAFRRNKARHDRMEKKEAILRNKKKQMQRAREASNRAYARPASSY